MSAAFRRKIFFLGQTAKFRPKRVYISWKLCMQGCIILESSMGACQILWAPALSSGALIAALPETGQRSGSRGPDHQAAFGPSKFFK